MSNNITSFPLENLVISEIKTKKSPRIILANKSYPIGFETPEVITPFGIDNAYGKFYIKLSFNQTMDRDFLVLLQKIEEKLQILVPGLKTNFSSQNTINCILDKNITIEDTNGNIVSMFGINKGDCLKATIELGDIYNNTNYKWIVKKLIRMR